MPHSSKSNYLALWPQRSWFASSITMGRMPRYNVAVVWGGGTLLKEDPPYTISCSCVLPPSAPLNVQWGNAEGHVCRKMNHSLTDLSHLFHQIVMGALTYLHRNGFLQEVSSLPVILLQLFPVLPGLWNTCHIPHKSILQMDLLESLNIYCRQHHFKCFAFLPYRCPPSCVTFGVTPIEGFARRSLCIALRLSFMLPLTPCQSIQPQLDGENPLKKWKLDRA